MPKGRLRQPARSGGEGLLGLPRIDDKRARHFALAAIYAVAGAAGRLRLIEGGVGARQECGRVDAAARRNRNTDTGTDVDAAPGNVEGGNERSNDPGGEFGRLLYWIGGRLHDDEFIPADAC